MAKPGFTLVLTALFVTAAAQASSCKVLLVPGAFGSGSSFFLSSTAYFRDYEDSLREKGCLTRKVQFPDDVTIEVRGRILRDQIEKFAREPGGGGLVLLAHSQGGLDARYALKTLGARGVSALVTIGTPHRGTPLADWVLDHRSRGSLMYWFLRIFGRYDLKALSFVGEMTEAFLSRHAENFSAVPGVKYGSAVASCQSDCHGSLRLLDAISGKLSLERPGAGDGLIPLESQRFGDDLGTYDLDHISEVSDEPAKTAERQRFIEAILRYIR